MPSTLPASRVRSLNQRPINPDGQYVLYWMIAARRVRWNYALQHAVDLCLELRKPLLVLEPLDVDYPHASDRLHRFVIEGMAANAAELSRSSALYYPYVEPSPHHGRGLLRQLAAHAAVVVTDHYPAFFLPGVARAAASQAAVRLDAVDSNGIIPLSAHGRPFTTARSYRAFVQRELRACLREFPEERPLSRLPRAGRAAPPAQLMRRWPSAEAALSDPGALLAALPIDHTVAPVSMKGGDKAGRRRLRAFLSGGLAAYAEERNHPDADCTSRLSPYLHFGHISSHEVFSAVMTGERWTSRRLAARGGGARDGWWGVGDGANAFLDQLVVWRELAFNGCEWIPGSSRYESLPQWARDSLESHAADPRRQYPFETLEAADTHDDIWNAAARQLATEGWFHGYLRMVWGKKILEWSPDPQTALDWMAELMNRYSLDGRDPVSYASFAWVLGRYDRPWPRRPVFGTVRYMSSDSTRRKLRMKKFLAAYGGGAVARR